MRVYVISADIDGKKRYKIGYTKREVYKRLKELKTSNSANLEIELVIESKWATKIEKELHRRFKDFKINGEWFNLNEEDMETIRQVSYITHENHNLSEDFQNELKKY